MRELALFAGAGGGILGGRLLGWRTVCAVEIDAYARSVLLARQRDGILEPFPIWDDVCTFDGKPWRGSIDIISGGFPCQDISSAGEGAGIGGARSGLWNEMQRIIGEVRPPFALVENSPMLTLRGLGRVLGDLAELGYDAKWGVISAASAGMPILRKRIWILAVSCEEPGHFISRRAHTITRDMGNNQSPRSFLNRYMEEVDSEREQCQVGREDPLPSYLCRKGDGVANDVDRLAAIGNGQVPAVVRLAWCLLQ